jgi:hypothetical protein
VEDKTHFIAGTCVIFWNAVGKSQSAQTTLYWTAQSAIENGMSAIFFVYYMHQINARQHL